jgi:ArsR family transcriptional regulator
MNERPMDISRLLKAFADPTRLRILAAVSREELTVGEIQEVVEGVQSSVSRHLGILREAGFVRDRREGTSVFFSLSEPMPEPAQSLFAALGRHLDRLPQAEGDRRRLEACRRRRAERSRDYFEGIAGDWERMRKSYFDDRVTSLALEKLVPPGLVVADIGCGTGSLALELARFASRVIALDISREMLRLARKEARSRGLKNVEFRRGDAERLPLGDAAVDAAFCVMVLHFLADPARAAAELRRVTRPGGFVIVVDLVFHTQTWMKDEMAHRWLGFEQSEVAAWFRAAGAPRVEFEMTGAYAGGKMQRNGKQAVEIFVARAFVPAERRARAGREAR